MSFLDENYEVPSTSNYMKFEEGANTFRILGSFTDGTAIMGTVYWHDENGKGRPVRVPMNQEVDIAQCNHVNQMTGEIDMPKHFWALPVYNYAAKRVQILEITQKGIMNAIKDLSKNKKWGDPVEYDLVVNKIKEGGKTSYTVTPDPKELFNPDLYKAYKAMNINISALFNGEDPFMSKEELKIVPDEFITEDVKY